MKVLNWKFGFWKILENFEKYFFFLGWLSFWLSFKCGGWNFGPPFFCLFSFPFLLHLPSTSLPPLALFTFFFPLIFVLHLSISSHKKHFSKLLNLPLSISINISLDPCVLSTFIIYPFLVKPIFFASKWLLPPRDLLFLLFMVRNMIQHLIDMMMMDFFKTLGPKVSFSLVSLLGKMLLHVSLKVSWWDIVIWLFWNFWGIVWLIVFGNIGFGEFLKCVFLGCNLDNVGGFWNFDNVGRLWCC